MSEFTCANGHLMRASDVLCPECGGRLYAMDGRPDVTWAVSYRSKIIKVFCRECKAWIDEATVTVIDCQEWVDGTDRVTFRCPICLKTSQSARR